jgi:hypothetical protein
MPSPADVPSRRSGSTRTTTRRRALDRRQEQSAPVFGAVRDRLIPAALLVYTVAVTLWMALSAPEEGAGRWIRELAPVVVAITAVVLAWHTSRMPAFDRGTRRFWKAVAVAVALSPVAHLLASLVVRPLSPAVADLIGLITPLLAEVALLAAFLYLPSAPPSGVPRTTLALDLSMVGVTGALMAWYGIAMHNPVSDPVPDFALLHAHATLEVMGLLIAFVWWRRTLLQRRAQVLMLLAAAMLLRGLAHAVAIVQMTYDLTKVDVVAIAEPVSLALIAAAEWFSLATVMHRQVRVRRERVTVLATVLPFVMVLPGFVLLLAYGMSDVPQAGSTPSLLGLVSGAVAGLVAVTPAAGFAGPMGSVVLGLIAGVGCFGAVSFIRNTFKIDDSLDVFGIHGVGGIIGALATGILVNPALGGAGIPDYLSQPGSLLVADYVFATAFMAQVKAVVFTVLFSGIGSYILFKLVDLVIGLRVSEEEEREGLDVAEHGERAYNM